MRYVVDRGQNQDDQNAPPPHAGRPPEGIFETNEYTRAPNTSNACIYYECGNESRCRIPASIKLELLVHSNYYIPLNARVCQEHLELNQWDQLIDAPNSSHDFTGEMFVDITKTLQTAIINNPNTMDFENIQAMDSTILQHRVGLTHNGFEQVIRETPSLALEERQPNTALAIFLMKLRTGESNERLSVLFRMSRPVLERKINTVRKCLLQDFVPRHLGLDHISRNEVVAKALSLPNGLYGNPDAPLQERKAIVVIDGTYIYIQKSSNFLFQRKTYSLHKYANLLKPFLIVCCDGYIIDVTGPHAATTSDATIMRELINENEENPFHYYFHTNDVFICDRGFRDVIEDMESCGYEAHMPIRKRRGENQLTTLEANKNRKVTICRWVVEVVNGRFKRDFRLFRQGFFNRAMSHMIDDFRVAAALINAFHVLIEDSAHASEFLRIISQRMHEPNRLGAYVTQRNVNRQRASFRNIEADVIGADEFPILTHQDLVLFALGTYHVKLARSYYAEHIRNGVYHIEVARDGVFNDIVDFGIEPEHALLLRARIQSRHARARLYYTYVMIHGRETISNYYCSCLSGMRTVGCCAHVMVIVWYFGWARHQPTIRLPAANLDNIIVDDG